MNASKPPVRVGLLGIGTVGGGTFDVLARNREEIARRAGRHIEVAWVVARDAERAQRRVGPHVRVRTDAIEAAADPDVDIVVEVMGGTTTARAAVETAIARGTHVVTANKALLATAGDAIVAAASARGVIVAFEAAISGCIPIVKVLREGLAGNRVEWIAGIINGTSNYILSEMRARGISFGDALAAAQRLGYAEADPTFDVEGIDAAHKIALLGAIGFGIPVPFDSAYIEGITSLTGKDVAYAEAFGYRIKLLGIARRTPAGIELRVHPTLVPAERILASVDGAMNAVLVKSDAAGVTMYYGAGAGAEPTASAIVADIVDVARLMQAEPDERVPYLAFQTDRLSDTAILPIGEVQTSYYLRVRVNDEVGVLADIARTLADAGISVDAMRQQGPGDDANETDIVILTHPTREKQFDAAMARLLALPSVKPHYARIRREELT